MVRLGSATCPHCGRRVALYIPRGGDGSAQFLKRHTNPAGQRCDGSGSMDRSPAVTDAPRAIGEPLLDEARDFDPVEMLDSEIEDLVGRLAAALRAAREPGARGISTGLADSPQTLALSDEEWGSLAIAHDLLTEDLIAAAVAWRRVTTHEDSERKAHALIAAVDAWLAGKGEPDA